jgi:hypothetical protein
LSVTIRVWLPHVTGNVELDGALLGAASAPVPGMARRHASPRADSLANKSP